MPPLCNQILYLKQKELYLIDSAELRHEFSNNNTVKIYL